MCSGQEKQQGYVVFFRPKELHFDLSYLIAQW